ncbi:MAG TPA: terminase family protein [Bryobacteraceae bacterium]|nr:terminase family protein [Bryobacteraceae bacterium]
MAQIFGKTCIRKTETRAAADVDAVEFAYARLGFRANEQQARVLRSRARRGILNCCRQWGKSTVTAAMAMYRAQMTPGCLVLIASPSRRQSAEWMRKARGMAVKMGIRPRGDGDNAVSLLLPNGSRIVGLPRLEDTVRGFSAVSLLLIDEAARVPDEMFDALQPMLGTTDGDMWLMSTPRGKAGFFYEMWEFGGTEWMRVKGPATECAQVSKRFLEEQRRVMSADKFMQEHMCCFVGRGAGLFDREMVEGILDDEVEPIF